MSFASKPRTRQALVFGLAVSVVSCFSYALPWASMLEAARGHASAPTAQSQSISDARSVAAVALGSAAQVGISNPRIAGARSQPRQPATERQLFGEHRQDRALEPSRRAPQQPALHDRDDSAYDGAQSRRDLLRRPSLVQPSSAQSMRAAKAACDAGAFGALSGTALVNAVKAADTDCINELFSVSGPNAYATFREAQMVSIANAFATSARGYDGSNADSTLQLILFLRAGYYVQYYDSSVGSYGAPLRAAIRAALDAFAANARFGLVNDVHGEVLAEFVTLIDSSAENARYLYVVKRLLDGYTTAYNPYYWMKVAVNNAYTITFRGHQDAAFRTLVQSDNSIVETLYGFANRNFGLLGQDEAYLVANAGRELGRFLQYDGALKTLTQARVKALIDRSAVTGPSARLWVGVGEMVDYYDQANCGYYGLCGFVARVEAAALPIRHTCGPTLRLRAQSMSAAELASTCSIVAGQEAYFHNALATGGVPVSGDGNASLEMTVFDSSDDYGIYAGAIYGIDTNNGGMYLEGDPSVPGNQARFIAYEAEWLRPQTFEIWNLTHEYVHYLDGRFNMWGDFGDAISQNTVWWIEGFAEYLSYSYRGVANTGAQDEAGRATYTLSKVYQNDYNSGQTLVYRWGYLAVRFMFEQRHDQVNAILGYFRPGNYTGYAGYMSSLGVSNDSAFRAWLPCVAQPDAPGCGTTPNQPPVAGFGYAATGLTVNFSDSSSDADGRIVSRSWNFGDGTSATTLNPSKTYAAAGSYTVQLTVTDDRGASHSVSKTVAVAAPGLPECAGNDTRVLGKNCARSNVAASAGNYAYLYVYLPAGTSQLRFESSGGSGNADMYVSTRNWATRESYQYRSTAAGNGESVTISQAQAGYVYVSLYGATAFSGVRVAARY